MTALPEASRRFPFPDRPRLWGTAVSHYQVEGGDECDWSEWERGGRTRGEACGAAVDSWTRYEEDAALARAIGANAFRFSISWSRVEPFPGWFDYAVLARYRHLVDRLIALDLEPVVTLFHYTHPVWFHELSPWTSPSSVMRFARFARVVAETLGTRVRLWLPLNEPMVFVLAGYYDAQIPPGIADGRSAARAFDHLLAAHGEAAAIIREANPDAAIGVAHNMMGFAPERPRNWFDRVLVRVAHRCYNRPVIEAFAAGRWDFLLPPATRIRGRRDDLPQSLDAFGVNFYSRLHLRGPGRNRLIGEYAYRDAGGGGLSDNGWEIVASEIVPLLRQAARSGLPLLITENGVADAEDRLRGRFVEEHIAAIAASAVPIHGYFHWSLLDNYEWLDGYGPKFGLYEVDRSTMERRPRPSAEIFRRLGAQFLGHR